MFRHFHRRNMAGLLAVGIACVSGASAYAFTASNTVPAHMAGAGSAVVSAYTVSSPTTTRSALTGRRSPRSRSSSTPPRRTSPQRSERSQPRSTTTGSTAARRAAPATTSAARSRPRSQTGAPTSCSVAAVSSGTATIAARKGGLHDPRGAAGPRGPAAPLDTRHAQTRRPISRRCDRTDGDARLALPRADGAGRLDDVRRHRRHQHAAPLPRRRPGARPLGRLVPGRRDRRLPQHAAGHDRPASDRRREGRPLHFKGDNNGYVDVEHPTRSQLVGALWLHIPGLGARARAAPEARSRSGLLVASRPLLVPRRRRVPPAPAPETGGAETVRHGPHRTRPTGAPGLSRAGGASLLPFAPSRRLVRAAGDRPAAGQRSVQAGGRLLVLRAAPPREPPTRTGTRDDRPAAVPAPRRPGRRSAFAYRFGSTAAHTVSGTGSLVARVSLVDGLVRTLPLEALETIRRRPGRPPRHAAASSLPPLLQRLETATDVHGSYTLTLVPRIRLRGITGGLPLRTTSRSRSPSHFDQLELQPMLDRRPPPRRRHDVRAARPVHPVDLGARRRDRDPGQRMLSAAGLAVRARRRAPGRRPRPRARGAARPLLGIPAGLGRLRGRDGEAERIRARYARFLVPSRTSKRRRAARRRRRRHGRARQDRRALRPDDPARAAQAAGLFSRLRRRRRLPLRRRREPAARRPAPARPAARRPELRASSTARSRGTLRRRRGRRPCRPMPRCAHAPARA